MDTCPLPWWHQWPAAEGPTALAHVASSILVPALVQLCESWLSSGAGLSHSQQLICQVPSPEFPDTELPAPTGVCLRAAGLVQRVRLLSLWSLSSPYKAFARGSVFPISYASTSGVFMALI